MFEPKIVKGKEEVEIETFKCGKWSYSYDNEYTNIYDETGKKLTTFYIRLTEEMVNMFIQGFETGFNSGREFGRAEKSEEIKKLLKL